MRLGRALGTTAVAALIREGKTFQLPSVLQTSKNIGMVTMNDALLALVHSKQIEPKEAWMKAVDKAGLEEGTHHGGAAADTHIPPFSCGDGFLQHLRRGE